VLQISRWTSRCSTTTWRPPRARRTWTSRHANSPVTHTCYTFMLGQDPHYLRKCSSQIGVRAVCLIWFESCFLVILTSRFKHWASLWLIDCCILIMVVSTLIWEIKPLYWRLTLILTSDNLHYSSSCCIFICSVCNRQNESLSDLLTCMTDFHIQ